MNYKVKTGIIKGARAGLIATGALSAVEGKIPTTQEEIAEKVIEFLVVSAVEFLRNWFKKRVFGVK